LKGLEEAAKALARDGAAPLRPVLTPQMVQTLEAGIEANIASPSPRAKVASATHDPGLFLEDFCAWRENAAYRRVIFESGLGAIAGALMGSATVRLYHDHMLTKTAGTRAPTPWRQDQPITTSTGARPAASGSPSTLWTRRAH
jgi:hypothetical protein